MDKEFFSKAIFYLPMIKEIAKEAMLKCKMIEDAKHPDYTSMIAPLVVTYFIKEEIDSGYSNHESTNMATRAATCVIAALEKPELITIAAAKMAFEICRFLAAYDDEETMKVRGLFIKLFDKMFDLFQKDEKQI